jgi:hypothetical protein
MNTKEVVEQTRTQAVLDTIKHAAETRQERDTWKGDIPAGAHIRQGDVQVTNPKDGVTTVFAGGKPETIKVEKGEEIKPKSGEVQIAVGEGVGARHCINVAPGVRFYKNAKHENHPLVGPIIEVDKGCEALLTHPEHRHFVIPVGTYQVTYQTDHLAEETRRLAD